VPDVLSLVAVLVFYVTLLLGLVALVALPTTACAWREGGFCDRRKHRARL